MKLLPSLAFALPVLLPLALSPGCAGGKKGDAASNGDEADADPTPDDAAAATPADQAQPEPQIAGGGMRAAPSESFSYATTQFARTMHRNLATDGENTAISGPSAQLALSMLALGAGGDTALAFGNLFDRGVDYEEPQPLDKQWHIDNERAIAAWNDTPGVELAVANGVWVGENFEIQPSFLENTATHYSAKPSNQPFDTDAEAAAKAINDWVSANTREKIKKLLETGDVQGAELVLTNAIAFKGKWADPFEEDGTRDAAFQAPAGEVTVPMMSGRRERISYVEGDTYTAIALPYEKSGASMIVVLPNEGVSLQDVEDTLDDTQLHRATMSGRRTVDVTLPKWKSETTYELTPMLQEMGLGPAFTQGEFPGITADKLVISKAVQKVFVEVNEEGTEAAAATGIVMRTTSAGPPPIAFTADRPFFWAIWHTETKTPLFMGRVVDPSAGS